MDRLVDHQNVSHTGKVWKTKPRTRSSVSTLTLFHFLTTIFLLSVTFDSVCCRKYRIRPSRNGLYDSKVDDVLPLNNVTFESLVIKSVPSKVWVVEFYNSWCGHCINFAPTWKRVGTDFKGK